MLTRRSFVRAMTALLPASWFARDAVAAPVAKGIPGVSYFKAGAEPLFPLDTKKILFNGYDVTGACTEVDAVQGWIECYPIASQPHSEPVMLACDPDGELRTRRIYGRVLIFDRNGSLTDLEACIRKLDRLAAIASASLVLVSNMDDLEAFRVRFLSINGEIRQSMKLMEEVQERDRDIISYRIENIRQKTVSDFNVKKIRLSTPAAVLKDIDNGISRLQSSIESLAN